MTTLKPALKMRLNLRSIDTSKEPSSASSRPTSVDSRLEATSTRNDKNLSPINWQEMPYSKRHNPNAYTTEGRSSARDYIADPVTRGLRRKTPLNSKDEDRRSLSVTSSTRRFEFGEPNEVVFGDANYVSPFKNGKRNEGFINPNLISSEVFYQFDYGYKNALPSDRIQKRKEIRRKREQQTMSVDSTPRSHHVKITTPRKGDPESALNKSVRHNQSISKNEIVPAIEEIKKESVSISNRKSKPASAYRNPNAYLSNHSAQKDPINIETEHFVEFEEAAVPTSKETIPLTTEKTTNRSITPSKRNVLPTEERCPTESHISSDYYCPKCVNHNLIEDKQARQRELKKKESERDREIIEDTKRRLALEAKMRENHKKEIMDSLREGSPEKQKFNSKRQRSSKDQYLLFKDMFDKQEIIRHNTEIQRQNLKNDLIEQIKQKDHLKNSASKNKENYGTSFYVGQENKTDHREELRRDLERQIAEKALREQEEDKMNRIGWKESDEVDYRHFKEDKNREQERNIKIKSELRESWEKSVRDKSQKKLLEKEEREYEKHLINSDYQQWKKQNDKENDMKREIYSEFIKEIKYEEPSSYRKQYEMKKKLKDSTTLAELPHQKHTHNHPCQKCEEPFPKYYLTKYKRDYSSKKE